MNNLYQLLTGFLTSRLGQEITQDIIDELMRHLSPMSPREIANQMIERGELPQTEKVSHR